MYVSDNIQEIVEVINSFYLVSPGMCKCTVWRAVQCFLLNVYVLGALAWFL